MKSRNSPIFATWLLEHCLSNPSDGALIGDIAERYTRGRSRAWYWKQVLAAIVISFCLEVRAHGLLALRAVATGWAIIFVYRYFFRTSAELLFVRLQFGDGFMNWAVVQAYWCVIYTLVLAPAGWIVARLHRQHQTAMVLIFAASKVLTFAPHLLTYAANVFSSPSFGVPHLAGEIWASITTTGMILLGGIWKTSRAQQTLSPK